VRVAFHVRGEPAALAPQLREIVHAVDPGLRVYDVLTLDGPVDRDNRMQRRIAQFSSWATALIGVIALLISIAGTYSVMAFTVARQTREIGIRMVLGADRRRIVTGVFSRALIEIALGILAGALIWGYVIVYQLGGADRIGLLLTTAAVLLLVGLLACGVPVRRALSIEPAMALREGG
jgi:ABC-type lipoprotein release transport system permease subunit